jgi:hypothetical protein
MKATFRLTDIVEMELHPLPFTDEDLELVREGLQRRRAQNKNGAETMAVVSALKQ